MDIDQLDIKRLRVFDLVYKHGSLSEAAQRLRQTVPAVSQQLRKLEHDIGYDLFQRLPNRLAPTHKGAELYNHVQVFFEHTKSFLDSLVSPGPLAGRISASIGNDLPWYFVPKISSFLEKHPDVDIDLQVDRGPSVVKAVVNDDFQISFGVFAHLPKTVESKVFAHTGLSVVVRSDHPLAKLSKVTLDSIARHKLIVLPRKGATCQLVEKVFQTKSKRPSYIEVPNCTTAITFARAGLGAAVVHSICATRETINGLRILNVDHLFGTLPLRAIYRRQQQSQLVKAILNEFDDHDESSLDFKIVSSGR